MKIDKYNFWQRKWVAFMKRNRTIWSPSSLLLDVITIRTSAVTGNRSGLAKRFHEHMRFSHLAWTASLVSSSTLQGDHLQGSWTVLPHGMSLQDHCDYLSLRGPCGYMTMTPRAQCQLMSSSVGSWPGSTLEGWLKWLAGEATGYWWVHIWYYLTCLIFWTDPRI